jgi:quercetin dioxygenase-like cupin family protein
MADSPFGTWNGVDPYPLFPGVEVRAFGGDQVLVCHVHYAPGTTVERHSHEATEQVMWIVEGDLKMTIGDETKDLGPGDVVVVNRGIEHALYSESGVTFVEALSPPPLDHVPDRERDLVLGDLGGSLHVER